MELALFAASFLFFYLGFPAPALFLRCGLAASLRFSPRAALALSGIAALCGSLAALFARGGLGAAPAPARSRLIPAAFAGGTLGRSLLLMFTARFTGSLPLLRVQVVPLLMLCLLFLLPQTGAAHPAPQRSPRMSGAAAFGWLCFFCGMVDGFFGAGGQLLFLGLFPVRIVRRRFSVPASAALLTACAQAGALLLTAYSGAEQVFPGQMVALLSFGAALGALAAEAEQKRGPLAMGTSAALKVYLILSALAGVEHAFAG